MNKIKKICIRNLSYNVTPDDLTKFFSGYNIVNINLISDHATGRFKKLGFIEFASHELADKALALNGQKLLGRILKISLARS